MLVFEETGKTWVHRVKGQKPTTNSTHIWRHVHEFDHLNHFCQHWWEASSLITAPSLLLWKYLMKSWIPTLKSHSAVLPESTPEPDLWIANSSLSCQLGFLTYCNVHWIWKLCFPISVSSVCKLHVTGQLCANIITIKSQILLSLQTGSHWTLW